MFYNMPLTQWLNSRETGWIPLESQRTGHVVKYGLDWISKTWTGLVKHGLD